MTTSKVFYAKGYQKLWGWFGLSYAAFLVLPRVLMHAMPDEWQEDMERLLSQYEAAFPNQPNIGTTVRATDPKTNRLAKMPDWLCHYRRPDGDEIRRARESNYEQRA